MNKESENMGLLPYNFELQYSMEETNSRYNIYSPRQQSLENWTIPFSVRRPRKTPTKNNVSFKTNITVVLKKKKICVVIKCYTVYGLSGRKPE